MEVILTKDNVMRILCKHFDIEFTESTERGVTPRRLKDKIYWEGNPDPVYQNEGKA